MRRRVAGLGSRGNSQMCLALSLEAEGRVRVALRRHGSASRWRTKLGIGRAPSMQTPRSCGSGDLRLCSWMTTKRSCAKQPTRPKSVKIPTVGSRAAGPRGGAAPSDRQIGRSDTARRRVAPAHGRVGSSWRDGGCLERAGLARGSSTRRVAIDHRGRFDLRDRRMRPPGLPALHADRDCTPACRSPRPPHLPSGGRLFGRSRASGMIGIPLVYWYAYSVNVCHFYEPSRAS